MYLCYVDESGTSDRPGSTSHFILAGIVLPIWHWKQADDEIRRIKQRYGLANAEIHTGWILRKYSEQRQVDGFESLDHQRRRSQVEKIRHANLLATQKSPSRSRLKQLKKISNRRQTIFTSLTKNVERSYMRLQTAFQIGDSRVVSPNVWTRFTLIQSNHVYLLMIRLSSSSFRDSRNTYRILADLQMCRTMD